MILVFINMKVTAKKRRELSQTVVSLLNTISTARGCGRCDFFQAIDDENMLCLLEEWETPQNFEIHRQSECFKVLRGAMDLLAESCWIKILQEYSAIALEKDVACQKS